MGASEDGRAPTEEVASENVKGPLFDRVFDKTAFFAPFSDLAFTVAWR